MIKVTVDDREVKKLLKNMPKTAQRAAEHALDQTAWAIYKELNETIPKVFGNPVPYTRRSLKVTKTKNHNMMASVWFKEPDRMTDHYLVPQVEGSERELKGFERALGRNKFIPSKHLKLDRYGNISLGLTRQILSVLGRAELTSGYQANLTAKSAKRNIKQRDYVFLPRGSRRGALPPGVYQRVADRFQGFNSAKFRRSQGKFGTYQRGKTVGKFSSIIRARGLKPVIIIGRQHAKTTPRLKFYDIAAQVYQAKFRALFFAKFSSLVG